MTSFLPCQHRLPPFLTFSFTPDNSFTSPVLVAVSLLRSSSRLHFAIDSQKPLKVGRERRRPIYAGTYEANMGKKDFNGTQFHEMPDQKDLDAALVLMDLANGAGWSKSAFGDATITKNENLPNTSSSDSPASDVGFSIIHFLSAVRVVLTTPVAGRKNYLCTDIFSKEAEEARNLSCESYGTNCCISASECTQWKLPSFTTQEIVQRLRLMPGDARILELKLRLEDLVRGALRIFSSPKGPPGVSSWKALTMYKRSGKIWSWFGPIPTTHSPMGDDRHSSTSPEAWGLKGRTLKKLVECFAEWLRASRDVLQKIARLPPPPLQLMLPAARASTERFNRTRNLKTSVCTISPSCDQVRGYFRKEEALRYLIPERPFSYTSIDGKKSSVAPFRRCSGKPSRKARDHFILKPNRPPCFTVLSLVRDAAARLPDGMGTRSDICTLVRDSDFIMEDISDYQVEHVISGALDRLHYERDPCVRFDRDSRLWIYLHGNREEEDFEDDGTFSKKIRKKYKLKRLHA